MDATTARQILDVSGDANEEDIKQAYREKTKDEHPDQSDDPEATQRFQNIKNARDVLLDDLEGTATASSSSSRGSNSTDSSRSQQTGQHRSRQSTASSSQTTRSAGQTTKSGASTNTQHGETGRTQQNSTDRTSSGTRSQQQQAYSEHQSSRTAGRSSQGSQETETHPGEAQADKKTWGSGVPIQHVTRGHFLEYSKITSEDKLIFGLSLGIIVYTLGAGLLHPQGLAGYNSMLGGIWIALCSLLGYRLLKDEVPRRSYNTGIEIRMRELRLSPTQGVALPFVGLFMAVLLAIPTAIIIAMVVGIVDSVAPGVASTLGLTTFVDETLTFGGIAEVLGGIYPGLVGLYSVAVAYLTNGEWSVEEYQKQN